jgi:phosphoglycerate dehydrogenase-like enzyme
VIAKARILILNGTCLDVAEAHRPWLASLNADIVADPRYRRISPDQIDDILAGAQAIIVPASAPILPHHMEDHRDLLAVSIAASGYESVDIEAATRCGIVVTYAPIREGTEVVADLTWGLMLAVARQIPHHNRLLQAGRYERGMGVAVWGKTLGIVGLGNIGRAVARRAHAFDMKILATEIRPAPLFVRQYDVELVPLEELLRRADFVSLHLRINDQTRGIIGRRELAMMKPSAFLINTARLSLVDESALQEAVLSRRIAGAAMDEPPSAKDSPVLSLPNFVCTPHLGNRAIEGADAVFRCGIENAMAVIGGRRPEFVLNPQVYDGPLRAPWPPN